MIERAQSLPKWGHAQPGFCHLPWPSGCALVRGLNQKLNSLKKKETRFFPWASWDLPLLIPFVRLRADCLSFSLYGKAHDQFTNRKQAPKVREGRGEWLCVMDTQVTRCLGAWRQSVGRQSSALLRFVALIYPFLLFRVKALYFQSQ